MVLILDMSNSWSIWGNFFFFFFLDMRLYFVRISVKETKGGRELFICHVILILLHIEDNGISNLTRYN